MKGLLCKINGASEGFGAKALKNRSGSKNGSPVAKQVSSTPGQGSERAGASEKGLQSRAI